jgi:hypothetical protein
MPDPVIAKKLHLGAAPALVLGAPESLAHALSGLATRGRGPFSVVLAFATKAAAVPALIARASAPLREDGALWIAYPKKGGDVDSDLSRDDLAAAAEPTGYVPVSIVALDATWSAMRLKPDAALAAVRAARAAAPKPPAEPPPELAARLAENTAARATWDGLAPSHRREYVRWITEAKRVETRASRVDRALTMLVEGQKTPT